MSKMLQISEEKVLELAKKCPQWKDGLETLFPDSFKTKKWEDIPIEDVYKWDNSFAELTLIPSNRDDINFFPYKGPAEYFTLYLQYIGGKEYSRPSRWASIQMPMDKAKQLTKLLMKYFGY